MRPAYRKARLALLLLAGTQFVSPEPRQQQAGAAAGVPHTAGSPSYQLRLGAQVYRHYCETCHGRDGRGDGFNAFNLDPKPRDLAPPEFQTARRDSDLAEVIAHGGASAGLSAAMPPWGKTLSTREQEAVVAYLRELARAIEQSGSRSLLHNKDSQGEVP